MDTEQKDLLVHNLEVLNARLAKQNSFWGIFLTGILYGIGFFIGSAIIATIALGMFGPWFGKIGWIRTSFQEGTTLLHQ